MTALPDEIKTTAAFSNTLRWLREKVLGLTLEDLAASPYVFDPARLAALETPETAVPASYVNEYDGGLYHAARRDGHELASALAVAHFGLMDFVDRAAEVSSAQFRQVGGLDGLMLGVDLLYEAGDDNSELAALSCSLWPAAHSFSVRYDDEDSFARSAANLTRRRKGLALVRAVDAEHPALRNLRRARQDERSVHWFAVDPQNNLNLIAVDPMAPITSLAHAWQVAEALGASFVDRGPLAWAMLLLKLAGLQNNSAAIQAWAVFDAEGPAAYSDTLAKGSLEETAALAPAADLIWSAARNYLLPWHSWYVQACNRIDIDFGSNALTRAPAFGPTLLTAADAAVSALVIYDHLACPRLPEVIGASMPVLTVTPTSLHITGSRYSLADYFWLPTGVDSRILYRSSEHGAWHPLQLTK
ncbi:Uncharacterised protein [Mycobacteroides abscessus subsp. abscessus]|uniref:hypothetical protein n=1 Tax=Mycobacteroides abscessus TaxID=36809 RepID=UPI00092B4B19|nr:hypothetical protein [Mycobacteroides abscessus]SHU25894.1 Uncharacterised protein [Mycobacteroides abscessus subsp. abscessus]